MINIADPNWILALGTIVLAFIGLGVWLVRLEGKVKRSDEEIKRVDSSLSLLQNKNDAIIERIFEKLSHIEITLANLLGKLSNEKSKD